LSLPNPVRMASSQLSELRRIRGREIGQGVALELEIAPEHFDRIEFRGVGRKELNVKSGMVGNEPCDLFRPVHVQPIPDHDDRPPQVPGQSPEKRRHPSRVDV